MVIHNKEELIQILDKVRFIIVDENILSHYQDIVKVIKKASVFLLKSPEESKNLDEYNKAIEFFIGNGITRKDKITILGGGATSDFGGFVASTILRGVEWDVIPTTLLSMVDASIGGKVGLNTKKGKNLIGSFHLPTNTYIYSPFLETLDDKNLQSGLGEIIKYAFLDKAIFSAISGKSLELSEIITDCASFKQIVVANDFKETNSRKILNLGHTFGHAFEVNLQIPHGHAVVMGLELILELYNKDLLRELEKLKTNLNIEISAQKCSFSDFWSRVSVDKKIINAMEIELIIPKSIGHVEIQVTELELLKKKLIHDKSYSSYFL